MYFFTKMEKFETGHSLKNIPVPSQRQYKKQKLKLIKRMRWKTLGFLGKLSSDNNNNNQTFDVSFIDKILYIFCYFCFIYNLCLVIATVFYRLIPIFRRQQFI